MPFMCGQRLVPFIRENLDELYAEPYFEITVPVYAKLLAISSATVNRILKSERQKNRIHGTSTTKAAGNLNKLIPIRAYFDWASAFPVSLRWTRLPTTAERPAASTASRLILPMSARLDSFVCASEQGPAMGKRKRRRFKEKSAIFAQRP